MTDLDNETDLGADRLSLGLNESLLDRFEDNESEPVMVLLTLRC